MESLKTTKKNIAGREKLKEKRRGPTSTGLKQRNKEKQRGGIMNSLRCAAAVYLSLAWHELQLPPAGLFGWPSRMSLKELLCRRFDSPSNSADIHAVFFDCLSDEYHRSSWTQKWN